MASTVIPNTASTTATDVTTVAVSNCQGIRCHQLSFLRGSSHSHSRNVFFFFGSGPGHSVAESMAGLAAGVASGQRRVPGT
jgi:hypothetical protein